MNSIAVSQAKSRRDRRRFRQLVFVLSSLVLTVNLAGCGSRFFDPTDIGRFRPAPAVNVILPSLGVAEETPSPWEDAEEPRPADIIMLEKDYVLSPGDVINVSIYELLDEGLFFSSQYSITETGKISIPEVGLVQAAGFTEAQLEDEIRRILSPGLLKEPSVLITLLRSEKRMVSILGLGVAAPSRYFLPRYGWRLADAIAAAGGIGEFNVSYIYVSRPLIGAEVTPEPEQPLKRFTVPEQEMFELITPQARRQQRRDRLVAPSAEMASNRELATVALPEGIDALARSPHNAAANSYLVTSSEMGAGKTARKYLYAQAIAEPAEFGDQDGRPPVRQPVNDEGIGRVEWHFQDGRWVPVQVGQPTPAEPPLTAEPDERTLREKIPTDFGWDEIGTAGVQTRVIKIPVDRFQKADKKYNIVIRPGDTIYVPVDIIGEFYVMGNTRSQGPISLLGREMTLKMAIAAAGGLGDFAWPKRCEVVRRLGKDREEIVMVDLDKIARGEQPDFFIKPDDLINVGTHPTARFRAILRNAFRATYGFGFVYDRNFADRDFGTHRPFPGWFPSIDEIF